MFFILEFFFKKDATPLVIFIDLRLTQWRSFFVPQSLTEKKGVSQRGLSLFYERIEFSINTIPEHRNIEVYKQSYFLVGKF